ncbi:MAG: WYL domain-containing protein [Methylococcaceae bacterium]
MNDQIIRQFHILNLLPRYPIIRLTLLILQDQLLDKGFTVGLRTLQRDLNALRDVFVGIDNCRNEDRSVSWFWSENAPVINLSGLTINQSLSFSLVKKYLTPLFPSVTLNELQPFFEQADATLESVQDNVLVQWPKKIAVVQPTQALLPPKVNPSVQKTVTAALLAEMQLEIHYQHLTAKEQTYKINPLGFVLRGTISYLIATKNNTAEMRIFALQRVKKAVELTQKAVQPDGFELQKYIDDGHMGFNTYNQCSKDPIQLKMIFEEGASRNLHETPLSEDQEITPHSDGYALITATLQENEQLFWWLLSYGANVEVLEPEALREKIANTVQNLADIYLK